MAFDYKKEYKEFYMPKNKPGIVNVPPLEGLCVQCMHIGSYDSEPATIEMMHDFMTGEGYELDITDKRLHHEIYLSDVRRVAPEKLKTVIRHPVKKSNG